MEQHWSVITENLELRVHVEAGQFLRGYVLRELLLVRLGKLCCFGQCPVIQGWKLCIFEEPGSEPTKLSFVNLPLGKLSYKKKGKKGDIVPFWRPSP